MVQKSTDFYKSNKENRKFSLLTIKSSCPVGPIEQPYDYMYFCCKSTHQSVVVPLHFEI